MSEKVLVVPREGLLVRDLDDDELKHLPPAGKPVKRSVNWERARLRGDVELRPIKAAPAKPADKGKE
jgi:hypothetical protein